LRGNITSYKREVGKNLENDMEDRGPIIPNDHLYESPLYAKTYPTGEFHCKPILVESASVYLAVYRAPPRLKAKAHRIERHVEALFDQVVEKVLDASSAAELLDTAILIPVPRPSGPIDPASARIRGGGVFVFGQRQRHSGIFEPFRYGIRLLHAIFRSVMLESWSTYETLESREAEQAFIAHEARVTAQCIHSDTFPCILDYTRMYFNILLANVDDERNRLVAGSASCEFHNTKFGHGRDLKEILGCAMSFAAHIQRCCDICLRLGDEDLPKDDAGCRRDLNDYAIRQVNRCQFSDDETWSAWATGKAESRERWYFFSALVAALRNVIKYSIPQSRIELSIENCYVHSIGFVVSLVKIRNKARFVPGDSTKTWPGSTKNSINHCIKGYDWHEVEAKLGVDLPSPVAVPADFQAENNGSVQSKVWVTWLPLPAEVPFDETDKHLFAGRSASKAAVSGSNSSEGQRTTQS
jgi:hypothetical protein